MSRFFCDSNCELWFEDFDKLNINLIQMPYTIDGEEKSYDLGRNIDIKQFFDAMRAGAKAKTQALNQYDYCEYFSPIFEAGEDIIYVTFSHKMSATFDALNAALEELKGKYPDRKATIVDTKNISIGAGLIVSCAAKMHADGASDQEIVSFVESFREKIKVYFSVGDLTYLKRGGRLTGVKAVLGTILNIKPIIELTDGVLVNNAKAQGRKAALKKLAGYLSKYGLDTNYPVYILQADCESDALLTKEQILSICPSADVRIQLVGPVIGSHCGPDTIGVVFAAKE